MEPANNFGIFYLLSFIQSGLYAYFFSEYLICENKKKRFIKVFCMYAFVINPFSLLIYNMIYLKMIAALLMGILTIFVFFKESSYLKKIMALLMHLIISFFSEMMTCSLFYIVHGYLDFTQVSNIEFIMWQLIFDGFIFLLCCMVIKYVQFKDYLNKKDYIVLFLMIASQLLLLYSTMLDLADHGFKDVLGEHYFFVIFIGILCLHILLIYILIKSHEKKVQEITMIKIRNEYQKQLAEYLKTEDKDIRLLRHDIINFIEEIKEQ